MYRKAIEKLKNWKISKTRKPLLITWARQVGKTFLIKQFGNECYSNQIYLNFENAPTEITQLFVDELNPKKILTNLEIYFKQEIIPWKTLIIFDEIQSNPRVLTSLKYFNELAWEYHIIASGSLLWIALHKETSFPVWKIEFLHLEPMDFEEFLLANGEEKLIKSCKKELNQNFNDKLYEYMKQYLFTGWMPEIVQSWITEQDVEKVDLLQWNILQSYKYDFSKYTTEQMTKRLTQIWESIPLQFAKENDKFIRWIIREWARAKDYEIALQRLEDSGLVRKVNRVKRWDKLPLLAYQEESIFKLYFLDIWLLRKLTDIPSQVLMNKSTIFDEYNWLFAEQFVLQNLWKYKFFYWTSNANAEVDFISQIDEYIIPFEVKSGKNTKSKSLKIYREKYNPKKSIRFSLLDYIEQEWLINIPLYLIFCFDEIFQK